MIISERQKQIYDIIVWYKNQNDGNSPSLITIRFHMIAKHGITISDETIGSDIRRMPQLVQRNGLGNLVVMGGKWELCEPQEITVG